ncbi:MAG: N-acetyltransferase [Acidiferrobacterales bacterium]|nr:N-acetyltransferase [Acidiferrobacterales bacterium]
MDSYPILHESEQELFYMELEDDQKAYAKYRMVGNRQVDFYSTLVPTTHRGQGLAAKLIDTGFQWATEQGLGIQTSCWYAALRLEISASEKGDSEQ